jgi:dodecin
MAICKQPYYSTGRRLCLDSLHNVLPNISKDVSPFCISIHGHGLLDVLCYGQTWNTHYKEGNMPVVKVIEILAESPQSWEAATRVALEEATKSVRNIKSIYVKEFQAIVEDDQIVNYRVNVKIAFVVQD